MFMKVESYVINVVKIYEHNIKINITTTKLMEYILNNDILICSKAKVSKYLINELKRILKIYMNIYLGSINEKSLNLLKSLDKKGAGISE